MATLLFDTGNALVENPLVSDVVEPYTVVQMIRQDHMRIRNLISEYKNASGTDMTGKTAELAKMIIHMIALHEAVEEDTIYLAISSQSANAAAVSQLLGEQLQTRRDIEAVMDKQPLTEGYDQKFQDIIDETEQHLEDEETQLLLALEKLTHSEQMELAGEYTTRRQELENLRI